MYIIFFLPSLKMVFSTILYLVKSYFVFQIGFHVDYFHNARRIISTDRSVATAEIPETMQQVQVSSSETDPNNFKRLKLRFSVFDESLIGTNGSGCPSVLRNAADKLPFEILLMITKKLSEREARIARAIMAKNCDMDLPMQKFIQALEYKEIKHETVLLISAQSSVVQVTLDHNAIKRYRAQHGNPVVLPILHEEGANFAFTLMKAKRNQKGRYTSFEDFRQDAEDSIAEAVVPYAVPGISLSIVESMDNLGSLMFHRASRRLFGAKSNFIFTAQWDPRNLTFEELQRLGSGVGFAGPSFELLPDQNTLIAVDFKGDVFKGRIDSGTNMNLSPVIQRCPNWLDERVSYWSANTLVRYNQRDQMIELINHGAHVKFNEDGGDFKIISRFDDHRREFGEAHETIVVNGEEMRVLCNSTLAIQIVRVSDGQVTFIPVLERIQQAMFNTYAGHCNLITVDPEEGKIFWSYGNSWKDFFVVMDLYDYEDQYLVPFSIGGETRTTDSMVVLSRAWLYKSEQ